jgi:hypothetical protein
MAKLLPLMDHIPTVGEYFSDAGVVAAGNSHALFPIASNSVDVKHDIARWIGKKYPPGV